MAALQFLTTNPVQEGWDRQEQRSRVSNDRRAARETDEAIRRGLAGLTAGGEQPRAGQQDPAMAGPPAPAAFAQQPAPPAQPDPMAVLTAGEAQPAAPSAAPPIATAPAPAAVPSAPRNPLMSVVTELSRIPGGGQAALQMYERAQRMGSETQRGEEMVLRALRDGMPEAARALAQRYGIQMPDAVFQNTPQSRLLGQALSAARALYPNKEQAQVYVSAFLQNGGNHEVAAAAAGAPRPAIRAARAGGGGGGGSSGGAAGGTGRPWQRVTIQGADGVNRLYWVNPRDPNAAPVPIRDPNQPPPAEGSETPPAPQAAAAGTQPRVPGEPTPPRPPTPATISPAAADAITRELAAVVRDARLTEEAQNWLRARAQAYVRAREAPAIAAQKAWADFGRLPAATRSGGLFGRDRRDLPAGAESPEVPMPAAPARPPSPARPGAAATPPPAQPSPREAAVAQARDAIARGAPREAVLRRLAEMGITDSGL